MKPPFFYKAERHFLIAKSITHVTLTFFAVGFISVSNAQNISVKPSNKNIAYEGRIGFDNNEAFIYWPGSSITINFIGTNVNAAFKDISGDNYFYIIVDNKTDSCTKLQLDTAKKTYPLAKNLPYGKHSIELYKLTNTTLATVFYGFEIGGKASILKPVHKPKRKINGAKPDTFYG